MKLIMALVLAFMLTGCATYSSIPQGYVGCLSLDMKPVPCSAIIPLDPDPVEPTWIPVENKVVDGMCYKEVEGREKENIYWVRCDEDNTDIGFNQPNCEQYLKGVWVGSNKCIVGPITWELKGKYLDIYKTKDVAI